MDSVAPAAATAPRVGFVITCSRCGDNLAPDVARDPSAMCRACVRLLGQRALDRLIPVRRWLSGLLVGCAVLSALSCVSSLFQLELLQRMVQGDFTQAEAEFNDLREATVGLAFLVVYLSTAVVWCIWFRRSHAFAKVGDPPMEHGPNAWGWFFVPIANLWKPYQAVKELWSAAPRSRYLEPPGVLSAWWAAWIISNVTGQASFRTTLGDSSDIQDLIYVTYLQIADTSAGVLSAVAAFLAMRAIDRALTLDD